MKYLFQSWVNTLTNSWWAKNFSLLRPWSTGTLFARFYHPVDRHCPLQTIALYLIFFVKSHQMRFLTTFSSRVRKCTRIWLWNTLSMNFAAQIWIIDKWWDDIDRVNGFQNDVTMEKPSIPCNDVVESFERVNVIQKMMANERENTKHVIEIALYWIRNRWSRGGYTQLWNNSI